MNLKLLSKSCTMAVLMMAIAGCNDDGKDWPKVDGADPVLELTTNHIRTEANRAIQITGRVKDADGIKEIHLDCPELSLKKVIDLIDIYNEPLKEYDLSYTHNTDKNKSKDDYTIVVTVVDVFDNTVSQSIKMTLDGDFTVPVFIAAPTGQISIVMESETKFGLEFCVTDNVGLSKVVVDIKEFDTKTEQTGASIDGFPLEFDAMGDDTYEYMEDVLLPSTPADYMLTITAYDLPAQEESVRQTVASAVLTVSGSVDFPKMYLVDVPASDINLDVFGVPMRVDRIGECQYRARYFNEKANTEIYFLAQKGGYTPVCYGVDPKDNTRLINSSKGSLPLVLPEAGKYYEINYNTESGEYEFHTYTVESYMEPIPVRWEYGGYWLNTWQGWDLDSQPGVLLNAGDAWMQEFYFGVAGGPGDIYVRFHQDAQNPHRFYSDPVHYNAGESLSFLIHNWHSHGWWNYCSWGVDDSDECDIFLYLGVCDKDYLDWLFPERNVTIDDWKAWVGSDGFRKTWQYPDGSDKWAKPVVINSGNYKYVFDSHLGRCKLVRE